MPIDASIYSLANRPTTQLESPLDLYSKVAQVQGMRQSLEQNRMNLDAQKKAAADNATLAGLARDANGDVPTMIQLARKNGLTTHADAIEKNWIATQKSLSELDETKRRQIQAQNEDLGKAAAWADTPEKWLVAAREHPQLGSDFNQREKFIFQASTIAQILDRPQKEAAAAFEQAKFNETIRHNKAMENKPTGMLGPITLPGENAASASEEYAKRLVQGLEPWPSQQTLRTDPVIREGIVMARRLDPTFNSATHAQRAATQKAFTVGKQGDNINALNTAMGHLGELSDYAEKLGNSNLRVLNTAKNWLAGQTGDADIAAFNTTKKAVADEVTRVWRGTGGSEADIQEAMKNLDSSQSPAQLRTAILQLTKLMHSKQKALEDQYQKGMGGNFGTLKPLDEEAEASLNKIQQRAGVKTAKPTSGAKSADDLLKLLGH